MHSQIFVNRRFNGSLCDYLLFCMNVLNSQVFFGVRARLFANSIRAIRRAKQSLICLLLSHGTKHYLVLPDNLHFLTRRPPDTLTAFIASLHRRLRRRNPASSRCNHNGSQ